MKYSYIINKILFFFTKDGFTRANFLRKKKLLNGIGENVFFQPRKLPGDPHLIKLHNNISIASGVTFINHDVMHQVFNYIEKDSTDFHMGCIEIMDNVFIGANSIILPNVKIGSNVIIAAGSVVTKDIPSGSVVAGTPARIIGKFGDVFEKRKYEFRKNISKTRKEIIDELWEQFDKKD